MIQNKKQVLIVEYDPAEREILRNILVSSYQVFEAGGEVEALQILEHQKGRLSLIFLGASMQIMAEGCLQKLKSMDSSYSSIPVIAVVSSNEEMDTPAALLRCVSDIICKPYSPQVVLRRVNNIVSLREYSSMVSQLQYDRLTGLYTKEYFYKLAKDILAEETDKEFDIVCSDIENFKLVNDIFGIVSGDSLLRKVGMACKESMKGSGICCHLNADQFACLVERHSYTQEQFADICKRISTLFSLKNISMKWGIYAIEDRSLPVETMCDRALLAARNIKGQYGIYYAVYDDALRSSLLEEQSITDSMETALATGQFEIWLQPQYRIMDNALTGAESLVRWNHPKRGLQKPSVFIPLFEKNGFISRLDQFVWDKTCALMKIWSDRGYPDIPVSVNVSRADIYNMNLPDIFMKIINKYGLEVSRLPLEITESAYTEDPEQIIEMAESLKNLGFSIEMDDFGSGYSSLNMLNQLSLDVVKLDMQFIRNETAKPDNKGILKYIMDIARSMGLSVVAEGVETKEQLEYLRKIGCDYAQGYYLAKPMTCQEFEELLFVEYRVL